MSFELPANVRPRSQELCLRRPEWTKLPGQAVPAPCKMFLYVVVFLCFFATCSEVGDSYQWLVFARLLGISSSPVALQGARDWAKMESLSLRMQAVHWSRPKPACLDISVEVLAEAYIHLHSKSWLSQTSVGFWALLAGVETGPRCWS